MFSSAQVARGKPFPDLFLFAAAQMGAEPASCLVIEDSVPGVTAAVAAGMRVVGFTGGGHWGHDPAGADLSRAGAASIFSDYSNLSKSSQVRDAFLECVASQTFLIVTIPLKPSTKREDYSVDVWRRRAHLLCAGLKRLAAVI